MMIKKMNGRLMNEYVCRTGCGHVTLTDYETTQKRVYCSACGEKTEMVSRGKRKVSSAISIAGLSV